MKANTWITLLVILCLALGAALIFVFNKSKKEAGSLDAQRVQLSNSWAQTSAQLADQVKTNIALETNVVVLAEKVQALSNELSDVTVNLAKTKADAKAAAQTAQEEMAKRDAKINELEIQRDDVTKRMTELNVSITNLEQQIADTEKKLAASEGDRNFLLKELKRLQAEKAELERQFNNLAFLREQVRKLRDELSISRRLDWIRRGLGIYSTSQKAGERPSITARPPAVPSTNFNLDVELRQDGSVKVAPAATNAPANK